MPLVTRVRYLRESRRVCGVEAEWNCSPVGRGRCGARSPRARHGHRAVRPLAPGMLTESIATPLASPATSRL